MSDQAVFEEYLSSLSEPLSDYTFAQLFTWGNSLRILWKRIRGHLCVFANGTGDLTMLLPPIGQGGSDAALAESFEIMEAYNAKLGVAGRSRVEYASEELLRRFDRSRLRVEPMGFDYVYDVQRMIDLAGGDLASKRQLKNRFLRNYDCHVEAYDPARHRDACLGLLQLWKQRQDEQHAAEARLNAVKRQKETLACELALQHAPALGLKGLVVYTRPRPGEDADQPAPQTGPGTGEQAFALSAFTLGEPLGATQSSVTLEKTDLAARGLAQFIFSEFCRLCWSDRPLVNAGDDWGLETLAWTKMSYRPVKLLSKHVLREAETVAVPMPVGGRDEAQVRPARRYDVAAAVELERSCFRSYCLTKRQLEYLQRRPSAVFLVAEERGNVVGEGIGLVRQHKRGPSGRIYSLAVSGRHRGRKIGQRLLRAMVDGLASRGVKRVYLEVEQTNTQAIGLYERSGFRRIGVLPDYYGPGRAALHMMREVTREPAIAAI